MIIVLMFAMSLLIGCGKGKQGDQADKTANGTNENAPEILDCIPAGSTFYMTKSLSGTLDTAKKFMDDIGAGEMMEMMEMSVKSLDDEAKRGAPLMQQLRRALRLDKEINSKDSAALVLVNPAAADINIVELLKAAQSRSAAKGEPTSYFQESKIEELVAVICPGKIAKLIVAKTTTEGPLTVITDEYEKIYAVQKGSHVVMSTSKIAVTAILNSPKSVVSELSTDQIAMIEDSELTLHLDLKPYKPMFEMLLNPPDENLDSKSGEPTTSVMDTYISLARWLMNEFDTTTIGLKLGSDGLNIDSICTAKPGSTTEKIFQAESPNAGEVKLLDSIPSQPYIVAAGMNGWIKNPVFQKVITNMAMSILNENSLYKIDEKKQARILELHNEGMNMITGAQLVVGGSPKGKGLISYVHVIQCTDSAKYRSILFEASEFYNGIIASTEIPPGSPKPAINYAKDAEKIGDLSVDIMSDTVLNKPEDDGAESSEMPNTLLGEKNKRARIAAPNAKTLVMTIGGASEGMAQAIKAAGGKGPIPGDPETLKTMQFMPKNPSLLALFNTGNLMDVIRTSMTTAGATPAAIKDLPAFNSKTPIAFGMKAKGSTLHTSLHIPKPVIKETVAVLQKLHRQIQQNVKSWMGAINNSSGTAAPGDF
jgi:hypothetical protein